MSSVISPPLRDPPLLPSALLSPPLPPPSPPPPPLPPPPSPPSVRGVEQQQPAVVRGDREPLPVRSDTISRTRPNADGQPPRLAFAARPRQVGDLEASSPSASVT